MTSKAAFKSATSGDVKEPSLGDFYRDYQSLVSYGVENINSQPVLFEAISKMVVPFSDFQHQLTKDLFLDLPVREARMNKLSLRDNLTELTKALDAVEDVLFIENDVPAELKERLSYYANMRVAPQSKVAPAREPAFA